MVVLSKANMVQRRKISRAKTLVAAPPNICVLLLLLNAAALYVFWCKLALDTADPTKTPASLHQANLLQNADHPILPKQQEQQSRAAKPLPHTVLPKQQEQQSRSKPLPPKQQEQQPRSKLLPQTVLAKQQDQQPPSTSLPHTVLPKPQDQQPRSKPLPLTELAGTYQTNKCQPAGQGFVRVEDTVLDPALAYAGGRQIPRVIHMTAKSRCMLTEFANNIDKWRFPNHSVFVHDDQAMEKLLYDQPWPEFPQLTKALECVKDCSPGALKADLWRLLIMWTYGGIYTDFDNAPNKFNGTTLTADDDGFFVVERVGTPSQWFFAVAPRHPIIYYTMQQALLNIYTMIEDVGQIKPVWTTGPGALDDGFNRFVGRNIGKNASGFYVGDGFRTARIVGHQEDQNEYVIRGFVDLDEKAKLYEKMNMTHLFTYYDKNRAMYESCLQRLRRLDTPHEWEPTLW